MTAAGGKSGHSSSSVPFVTDFEIPGPTDQVDTPIWKHTMPRLPFQKGVPPAWGPWDDLQSIDLVILGEGPGRFEKQRGLPFVGPSGVLLHTVYSRMERSVGPFSVYVLNVFPEGRPEGSDEDLWKSAEARRKVIQRDILAVSPRAVLALGRYAAIGSGFWSELGDPVKHLISGLGDWVPFTERVWYGRTPDTIIPTVLAPHPAAIIRRGRNYSRFLQKFNQAISELVGILSKPGKV